MAGMRNEAGQSPSNGRVKVMSERVAFEPLENGLDYLRSVINRLTGAPTPRDLKYAILHLAAGIEVLAKYRLVTEHWTLVLAKPDSVDRDSFARGDFKSITGEIALSRLRKLVGLPLTDEELESVKAVQQVRNKLQHFGLQESAEAIEALAARALDFLLRFIDEHLAPIADLDDSLLLDDHMADIREGQGRIRALVEHRMQRIQPELSKSTYPVMECPRCRQRALLWDEPPRCAYCSEKWVTGTAAANEYASTILDLDWYTYRTEGAPEPVEHCPECGQQAVVWLDPEGEPASALTALCMECGEEWDDRCERCGCPATSEHGETTICSDCWEYIIA